MKLTNTKIIVILILLSIVSCLYIFFNKKYNEKKEKEKIITTINEKRKTYYKYHKEIENLLPQIIDIDINSIKNGVIKLKITNNTKIDIRTIDFDIRFGNAFGDCLGRNDQNYRYDANDLSELLLKKTSSIVGYHYPQQRDIIYYFNNYPDKVKIINVSINSITFFANTFYDRTNVIDDFYTFSVDYSSEVTITEDMVQNIIAKKEMISKALN
jgi:hypothetical protein